MNNNENNQNDMAILYSMIKELTGEIQALRFEISQNEQKHKQEISTLQATIAFLKDPQLMADNSMAALNVSRAEKVAINDLNSTSKLEDLFGNPFKNK